MWKEHGKIYIKINTSMLCEHSFIPGCETADTNCDIGVAKLVCASCLIMYSFTIYTNTSTHKHTWTMAFLHEQNQIMVCLGRHRKRNEVFICLFFAHQLFCFPYSFHSISSVNISVVCTLMQERKYKIRCIGPFEFDQFSPQKFRFLKNDGIRCEWFLLASFLTCIIIFCS